ncbi:MAG TPA: hypothetical protein VFD75_10560, partial [Pyrinomonadaceae bacterium]|nr:hypothetical protein [Pyrinomonadaceae bacterium]
RSTTTPHTTGSPADSHKTSIYFAPCTCAKHSPDHNSARLIALVNNFTHTVTNPHRFIRFC